MIRLEVPAPDPAQVTALAARLESQGRRRPGRSLSVLHVRTGGCGGCAREVASLDAVAGGLARLGLALVDTPLHADVLLATGPLVRNALPGLLAARAAMAVPGYVVAIGDCAATGLPFGAVDSYAMRAGGLSGCLPVDLVVRGSPPPPEAILQALATLRDAASAG